MLAVLLCSWRTIFCISCCFIELLVSFIQFSLQLKAVVVSSVGCREQFASCESVLAYNGNRYLRNGTCQPSRHDLPAPTPASLRHAQFRRGGKIRRLLRQGAPLTSLTTLFTCVILQASVYMYVRNTRTIETFDLESLFSPLIYRQSC